MFMRVKCGIPQYSSCNYILWWFNNLLCAQHDNCYLIWVLKKTYNTLWMDCGKETDGDIVPPSVFKDACPSLSMSILSVDGTDKQ